MLTQTAEAYTWRAVYEDDKTHIYENAGNSFAEVDQSRVKAVLLLSLNGNASHRVDIPAGAQAVFFRRHSTVVRLADESETKLPVVHCIGWKQEDRAVYLFVSDDGSTLLTTDLQAV